MAKPLYADVIDEKKCFQCGDPARPMSNYCSNTCRDAYWQMNHKDRVERGGRTRDGREKAGRTYSDRRQYHDRHR